MQSERNTLFPLAYECVFDSTDSNHIVGGADTQG